MRYDNQQEDMQPEREEEREDQPAAGAAITPEEYLAQQKATISRRSWWAVGIGAAVVVFHLLLFFFAFVFQEAIRAQYPDRFGEPLSWKILFRSLFFILGLFVLLAGIWGLREAKRLSLEDLIPSPEAVAFARAAGEEAITPYYSYIIVACLIAVFLFELAGGTDEATEQFTAITTGGLLKPDVWSKGEFWRILTSGVLHGGFLHIYFNSQAFYGFGSLIEFLSNRAHLAIIFLLSVVGGGILSMIFMPVGVSVGASGGIMGLIGYLAVYGYRRKQQLPPDFLRTLLVNIGFIAAFGLVAYQIIDNFGHLGGLLVGVVYGLVQVPRDLKKDPRKVGAVTEALGMISIGVFVFVSILTILLIRGTIKF